MAFSPDCVWSPTNYTTVQNLRVTQQTKGSLTINLTDTSGNIVDLSDYTATSLSNSSSSSSSANASTDTGVYLVAKDRATDQEPLLFVQLDITDPENGILTWNYTANQLRYPGIWLAQILLVKDDNIVAVYPYYLEIQPNLNSRNNTAYYPLSIAEVRMYLRDTTADANYLLDSVEFNDAEIAYAIRRPVDQWNETPPPTKTYSTTNFPYRYYWTIAVAAELLKIAAYNYERNRLAYSAGGVSIDDKNKAGAYLQIAERLEKDWKTWLLREKIRQSALQCNYSSVLI